MKKNFISLIAIALLSSNISFAQTGTAIFNDQFIIEVPEDQPLARVYVLDAGELTFKTPEQMDIYFRGFNDNVVEFIMNKTDRVVEMHVSEEYRRSDKLPADLNKHLSQRAARMKERYLAMQAQ
jgi:hypothetical protein